MATMSMSPQPKPSEVLTSLASSLPAETFLKLLAQNVYPALDCLPDAQRSEMVSILQALQKDHEEVAERIALIDYDAKQESLQKQLKALKKHVQRDWRSGYETQSEMMGDIAGEIVDWLPLLWTVGVEDGYELTLIHKCLKLCYEIVDGVHDCGSRAEFGDIELMPIIIENNSGQEIYAQKYGSLYMAISWVWRELLVTTIVNNPDDGQTKTMIDDIERIGFLKDVEGQLRSEGATKTIDGYGFYDEHWSDRTREAASSLIQQLTSRRTVEFENKPTYNIYCSLVSASPELKEALLEIARKHFFQEKGASVSWSQAVKIFGTSHLSDDVVRVLESTNDIYFPPPAVTTARREAVLYLMVQSDEYRKKARPYLENGLAEAQKAFWSELDDAFPCLDEAYEYLDEQLESKRFTKRPRPNNGRFNFDRQRDDILEKFVKLARRGSYSYERNSDDEDYEYEQAMEGIEQNDSDYEEMRESLNPDVAGAIENWLAILDKWPNSAEAEEMRSKLRCDDDDPFYTIEGVADALADRCSFDWNHSNAKVHVADGIRTVYAAFGPAKEAAATN